MSALIPTIRRLVALFDELNLRYAIMGGWAVRAYGLPRPTYDVDFTAAVERHRLGELYQAAMAQGFTVAEPYLNGWVDTVAEMPVVKLRLYLQDQGIDVDIFLAESLFQQEILARRRVAEFDGLQAWLVSPEDLVLLKLIAARPRDLADVRDVLFIQGRLDEAYLRSWAEKLGVSERLEPILAEMA